jgi:ankyrin repeat protein
MSAVKRALPARPSLSQQKKLAKELIAAARAGDPNAMARIRAQLPDKQKIGLTDAQFTLAREYGFASWRELVQHIEQLAVDERPLVDRFRHAFAMRDAEALRRLRTHGAEIKQIVNEPMFDFNSPALVAASWHDDVDVVDALLELGADPNRKSEWWAGPFHALYHACGEIAEHLLAAGATPDACAAAALDRIDLLEQMLAADPSRVHERGGDGQTPLHFARTRRMADFLLAHGADIDARDVDHRSTPAEWMLTDAADPRKSRIDVARYLVERGASADIFMAAALGLTDRARALVEADPRVLALRTGQGEYAEQPPSSYHVYLWSIGPNLTPLQTAAKFGQRETLAFMLRFASPEQQLLVACHEADGEAARRIVAAHPGIVAALSGPDAAALGDEAWVSNERAVRLMLQLGFDPAAGEFGQSALHRAAWAGAPDIVAMILATERGRALLEAREAQFGGTPLGWCCHGSVNNRNPAADHVEVARLLIAAGVVVPDDMEGSEAVQVVLDGAR